MAKQLSMLRIVAPSFAMSINISPNVPSLYSPVRIKMACPFIFAFCVNPRRFAGKALRSTIVANFLFNLVSGELHEGSNWEAIMFAGHKKLKNLVVLVDCNELSQVGRLEDCCSIEPLESKFRSFNFEVFDVDGHNELQIDQVIKKSRETELPKAILCRTIKGKGISFMERNNLWHYKSPQGEDYEKALAELN